MKVRQLTLAIGLVAAGAQSAGIAQTGRATQTAPELKWTSVSGDGYEGLILPESLAVFGQEGGTAWSPSADDIRKTEERLRIYFADGARDGELVVTTIAYLPTYLVLGESPPSTPSLFAQAAFKQIAGSLAKYRREYIGRAKDQVREIWIKGCLRCPKRDDILYAVDQGCGFWSLRFEMSTQRVTRFSCQGNGG